jgi:predicted TIM-barrel fold metal-dependent hydrolase
VAAATKGAREAEGAMMAMADGIVDAHHHIWRQQDLPWLVGPMVPRIFGPYEAIRRDYPMAEFRAEAEAAGVVASIYVQANWRTEDAVREVEWVESAAAGASWPAAIVGFCDLGRADAPRVLDRMRAASPRLAGIRQQLHWHENPHYRFAARADMMVEPAWRRGLAAVADRGLLFELQIFMGQAEPASALLRDFPSMRFVLAHAGMPEDLSPAGFAAWREGLARLAAHPNLAAKLSGLGTFVRHNDPELIRRIMGEALALFGPDRCLFGSNFPIEKLWTDYRSLLAVHLAALAGLPAEARQAVLAGNARRLYRVADSGRLHALSASALP